MPIGRTRRASVAFVSFISISCAPFLAVAQSERYSSDFNGDGFDDLAIGVPGKAINGADFAGAIRILYGSKEGLVAAGNQLLARGSGAPGAPFAGERFGARLAVGDFNGDGLADLATSTPLTRVSDDAAAPSGSVTIFYGARSGLGGDVDEFRNRGTGAAFGEALVAGDFNNDGFDELAVGVPQAAIAGASGGGAVLVYKGASEGLTQFTGLGEFNGLVTLQSLGLQNRIGARFGAALAAGEFNGDEFPDLAVGAPEQFDQALQNDKGGDVIVVFGSAQWLSNERGDAIILNQDTASVDGKKEPRDGFGAVLVAADFDGRNTDDLAVGVPSESFEGAPTGVIGSAGVMHLFVTTPLLSGNASQFWHQNIDGVAGEVEAGDLFGAALGAGDFNADGRSDLVVGATGEDFVGYAQAGVFHVIYGPPRRATVTTQQLWSEDTDGLGHGVEEGDQFGGVFGSGDFNGDHYQDLAIGAPNEKLLGSQSAGSVIVLYGGESGLTSVGSQFWAEHSPGLRSAIRASDFFGASLSSAAKMAAARPIINCGLFCRVFGGGNSSERENATE